MAEQRRTLVAGLTQAEADKAKEESFVYQSKIPPAPVPEPPTAAPAPTPPTEQRPGWSSGRVPLTTRIRPDLADRLKRLSLERQLSGEYPSAIQDILEEALQLWFLKNNPQP